MTSHIQDVSINAQEQRLIDFLTSQNTGINRYEADEVLNICTLSARISDLKAKGYVFRTIRESAYDLNGRMHPNIVRHWLVGKVGHKEY